MNRKDPGVCRARALYLTANRSGDHRWIRRFDNGGIENLYDRPHTGRPSRLSEGRMASSRAMVQRCPANEKESPNSWTAKELCSIVGARHGVTESENGMLTLLRSLDHSWQTAWRVHSEAEQRAQADFRNELRVLIAEAERIEVWLRGEGRETVDAGIEKARVLSASRPSATPRSTCSMPSVWSAQQPFGLVLPLVRISGMQPSSISYASRFAWAPMPLE